MKIKSEWHESEVHANEPEEPSLNSKSQNQKCRSSPHNTSFQAIKVRIVTSIVTIQQSEQRFFCDDLFARIREERINDSYVLCSKKAVFHSYGTVSKDYAHIQGSEDPNSTLEHVQDSPKVNMFCVQLKIVYVPIFFTEPANANIIYLNMLEMWL